MGGPGAAGGRVLVVGRRSFLAGEVLRALPAARVRAVGHDAVDRPDLFDGVGCVVNFGRHPLLGQEGYRIAAMDPDLRLARRLGEREIAYLMLSSRKVYAPGGGRWPRTRRPRRSMATGGRSSRSRGGCASCWASA